MTIFDPTSEEDIDISVTPNGPEVQQGVVAMLTRLALNSTAGGHAGGLKGEGE